MSTEQPEQISEPTRRTANRPLLDLTLVVASVLLLALAFVLWMRGAAPTPREGGLETGRQAPPIKVAGWINGELPPPAECIGKVLVVNAWFTTCPNCLAEAPELIETYNRFRDREVVFIGLTYEGPDRLPQIKQFIEQTGISWPNGFGALETLIGFEAEYFPAAWVISPAGVVVWNNDSPGRLADGIEQALPQQSANAATKLTRR